MDFLQANSGNDIALWLMLFVAAIYLDAVAVYHIYNCSLFEVLTVKMLALLVLAVPILLSVVSIIYLMRQKEYRIRLRERKGVRGRFASILDLSCFFPG